MENQILWKFSIAYYKGTGRTVIATAGENGLRKLQGYHSKGYVTEPKQQGDVWMAEVVDEKFLTFSFKPKR
ncbi:hypothetical protein [Lactococcus raffinolactis]|uniref:hypothetical protein n=1 Tax=Pseudolactococcus raffinolactis TaxID=1366 RepID=UPI0039B10EA4